MANGSDNYSWNLNDGQLIIEKNKGSQKHYSIIIIYNNKFKF